MQGKTINGYTLQYLLGIGGMAEVWYAENAIGKKAAVKLLLPKFCADEAIVARFQNEAKIMVQLDHPNIRQVYDYGSIDGRPCIVMEYLDGDDLKALMKKGKRFTDEELRRWWNQIAEALNYTHAKGIVHRDIKPSNIFLNAKGNIKLLDFGIAKIKESISMTQTGSMMGTLIYMSPEQVEDSKHIGPESDVYSLAVSFVHLLTGKAPYDSTTSSDYAIRKGIVEIPLDISAVPAEWQGFLAPYLAKKPEDRPALRPFEALAPVSPVQVQEKPVTENNVMPVAEENDETITVDNKPLHRDEPAVPNRHSEPSFRENRTQSPTPNDKPRSKKGLWIGLATAAVAALVTILIMRHPDTTTSNSRYVHTANGHEYVDLGLPSGTLWATCNVGADKPEEYGNYYAWGETQTKGIYNWATYKYANNGFDKLTKYCNVCNYANNGYTDNLTTLLSSDDPATANWGSGWCTPNKEQWDELLQNTTNQWTTKNGVAGRLFTSKKNGQTLFLPAAGYRYGTSLNSAGTYGYYWSSSLDTDNPNGAWGLYFGSGDRDMSDDNRYGGLSVRPVRSARQN